MTGPWTCTSNTSAAPADVIHELGYPSKGALLSWYADRLEEERTGVPSRRGERYRRYSDEQKRAAVDHYSNTADGPAAPCGCWDIRKARSCS